MRFSFALLFLLLGFLSFVAWLSSGSSSTGPTYSSSLEDVLSTSAPLSADELPADPNDPAQPTMEELRSLAREILANLRSNVQDYTATLVKRERIGGHVGDEVRMQIKVRNALPQGEPTERTSAQSTQPTSNGLAAYLKFLEPKSMRGREVIWIDGANENKMIVHEAGMLNLMRVHLPPDGALAMLGNKYPITEIGLVRLVEKLIEKIDRGVDLSQCSIAILEDQMVGEQSCRLIQVTQPRSVPGADFYIAQVFIDNQRQVPVRYAAFLWPDQAGSPPPLEEEYTYLNLQLNVGLTDTDFDPDNPAYQYP